MVYLEEIVPEDPSEASVRIDWKDLYNPVTIDSAGRIIKTAPPNARFTMNGNEQYVNSGWLVPKAGQKDFPGSSNTFTVIFQKAGTYNYLCILHPWMSRSVVVK